MKTSDKVGKEMKVLTKQHPEWKNFSDKVSTLRYCDGTLNFTKGILRKYFPKIDIEGTLEYLGDNGGYCDCEVIMNVILEDE